MIGTTDSFAQDNNVLKMPGYTQVNAFVSVHPTENITLSVNGREVEIDSRPSDALALAVRSGAPIFAAEDVIAESAIEFEHEVEDTEEVVDKFKRFLDEVTPEDFASGSG